MGALTHSKQEIKQGLSMKDHIKIGLEILHVRNILSIISETLHDSQDMTIKDDLAGLMDQAQIHINELKVRLNSCIFSGNGDLSHREKVSVHFPDAFVESMHQIRRSNGDLNLAAEYLHFLNSHLTASEVIKHLFCLHPRLCCPYLKDMLHKESTRQYNIVREVMKFTRKE